LQDAFHSLGDDLEAECVSQAHHRENDRFVLRGMSEPSDEGSIDLERAHRESAEVTQRRVPRAEVVHREAYTEGL
jgi:hypothetical protein